MKIPLVYVLVLNWNLPDITFDCVKSILLSDYQNYRIVVIDNGSEETNYIHLIKRFNELENHSNIINILREGVNLGFSGGINQGIKLAIRENAELIVLINNDTVIHPSMLSIMVNTMVKNSEIGILGPIIYYMDFPTKVWFSGYHIPGKIYLVRRGYHLKNKEAIEYVDFINGCGMMIRKEVIDDIGLFPEVYFMYYEDLEYCLKAKQRGWKLACHKDAKMWHAVSLSLNGSDAVQKEFFQVRSSIIFFHRNTKGLNKFINIILRLLQAGLFCFRSFIKGKLDMKIIPTYTKEIINFLLQSEFTL